jgi:nucleoside-diphosphate-sugar epimerase
LHDNRDLVSLGHAEVLIATRILLAGATGAIGRRLVLLLVKAGHETFGTTRSKAKAADLRAAGVEPLVVDVFNAAALERALVRAAPEVVIHQLTDLPPGLDPKRMAAALPRNARIRIEGTQNLVNAACVAGARRFIAQSVAWAYAPGPEPHDEDDPLEVGAEGDRGITVNGVAELERLTLGSPPLEGIVLRYGQLYGPGTGREAPAGICPLHVDAAARAALLAISKGKPGAYNIAEPNKYVSTAKARRGLGWSAIRGGPRSPRAPRRGRSGA